MSLSLLRSVVHAKTAKDEFPVIYSTLDSDALVSLVRSHYEIGVVSSCQFWNRGLSDVYVVETERNPYILRVSHHHWRSKADIDFELEFLDFLHQHQLSVAYPLHTNDGRLSVEINAPEGKRYAALFTYAPGDIAFGDLSPSQSFLLGETLAKVHQVGAEFCSSTYRQPLTLEYLLDHSFDAIAPFLKHRTADLDYLIEVIAGVKHQLEEFPKEPPFWVVCWGDPHSGNAHFTEDNNITLFDFDQCGYGWRAFDIAKFLQVSLRTGISLHIREAFLDGYQSILEISEIEFASLQAFTQTSHIWSWAISLNSLKMQNYSRLDNTYLHQRIEQLKMLRSSAWQLF